MLNTTLKKICGPNEVYFVNEICKRFIAENRMKVITSKIEELLKSIYCFQNEVLSLMGVRLDYEKVGQERVRWLGDLTIFNRRLYLALTRLMITKRLADLNIKHCRP